VLPVAVFLLVGWQSAGFRSLLERIDRIIVPGLYVTLGVLVALSWAPVGRRRLGASRLGRILGVAAGPTGLAASGIAFSIPVLAGWHRGHAYSMISGAVPWGDAHLFAGGAQRLLFLDQLDTYNSRRPFTGMFLALRLAVTGLDLRLAMLIGALVLGAAVFLAARAVARDLGPLAGLALFVGVYGFARYYVPATVSETLGVTFAAIALAGLWTAVRNESPWLAVGGVVLLTLALDVRAGVFLLPVLMSVWLARRFRAAGRLLNLRVLGASILAIVVTMALNLAVVAGLGGDTGNSFGNGGMLLYGMAKGHAAWDPTDVSWFQVYQDHPEILAMTDGERNRLVNSLAREEIVANPGRFLGATIGSYENYLGHSKQLILGPWPVHRHRPLMVAAALAIAGAVAVRVRRGRGEAGRGRRILADLALFGGMVVAIPPLVVSQLPLLLSPVWLPTALVVVAFVGLVVVGTRSLPVDFPVPLTLVALLAAVLSLPFIGTDSIRLFADGIVILSLPLALAVAVLTRPRVSPTTAVVAAAGPRHRALTGALPLLVAGGLVGTLIVGTPVARAAVGVPELRARTCPDGRPAEPLIGGVAVKVVADPVGPDRTVDQLGLAAFTRELVNFFPVPYGHLSQITGPATVLGGITPDGTDRFAILDGDVGAPGTSVLYLCGQVVHEPITDYFFSFAPNPVDVFRGWALED
jgi:hypothetical protein